MPTIPFVVIIAAANTVSRASVLVSLPPVVISVTISATSITVTATARTSEPNGSPTRCATTSAWWTADRTDPARNSPTTISTGGARLGAPRQRERDQREHGDDRGPGERAQAVGEGHVGPQGGMPRVSSVVEMRARAVLGSLLFLLVAPGVVAGLIPWWLTGWEPAGDVPAALVIAGAALVAGGSAVLLHAFARFALDGLGTPAPVAPTAHLVVGGAYRHVRNPMYLAVGATILGQALILGRPGLLVYLAAFGAAVAAFVHGYEEPELARTYGAEYDAYRRAVPAWIPRLRGR